MNYPDIPDVTFLGDVHLGRRFIEGVPLERRGEREEAIWKQFKDELFSNTSSTHIQVGDLFDTFDVPNEVVLRAARIYKVAAHNLPGCHFYILRGNHDASRNATKASSFDLLKALLDFVPSVSVVTEPMLTSQGFGLMPWSPFRSASVLADDLLALRSRDVSDDFPFVVCHCDTKGWNGDDFNVIPLSKLRGFTQTVVSGHEHIPIDYKAQGVTVHITGSMQPYSHGEDPEHTLYWTGTPDELAALPNPEAYYLRVILQPGETPPAIPNCLGYKVQIGAVKDDTEESDISVDFEDFDTSNVFKGILKELGVKLEIQSQVIAKFEESLNA